MRANGAKFPAALAAAALAAAGCGGSASEGGGGGEGGGFQMPPTAVEVAPVVVAPIADVFETVGGLEAGEAVHVVSEIDAAVISLPFREGDRVGKGALLAQLDDAELAADLARAEALRDQAKSMADRVKSVVEQGAAAPQDWDDAEADLRVAEANADLARARLAKTRITAPFSGVVGAREVSPGAFLRAGSRITDLAQLDELKVVFAVPERYAADLHRGREVTVSTTAYPGYELSGKIDVVDPTLDPATRSVRVIARMENPEQRFRPGMSANVRSVLAARESALTVPSEAVFAEGAEFLVYVVQEDGTVARTPIQLGIRLTGSVEVVQGLTEGQLVVRAGHQKLYPGAKVMAVNSQAPAGGGGGPIAPPAGAAAPAEGEDGAGEPTT
ncbi:MAG: efflux RND transporter periplasmic adaptor subunit [Candidatus Eiseniibacteriota bacterium]